LVKKMMRCEMEENVGKIWKQVEEEEGKGMLEEEGKGMKEEEGKEMKEEEGEGMEEIGEH
jgi:hypothetical protein